MTDQQLSINTDEVQRAVDEISEQIRKIQKTHADFLNDVVEASNKADGKFAALNKLKKTLDDEANNLKGVDKSIGSITEALEKYAKDLAEIDSADEF